MKNLQFKIQKILFNFCLKYSQVNRMEYSISGNTNSNHTYNFFYGLGRKMLIVRNNDIYYLGSALQIQARFNEKGKMEYCRPMYMNTQKTDLVFYGKKKVYEEYEKYKLGINPQLSNGLVVII
jgi:hypothetical protein